MDDKQFYISTKFKSPQSSGNHDTLCLSLSLSLSLTLPPSLPPSCSPSIPPCLKSIHLLTHCPTFTLPANWTYCASPQMHILILSYWPTLTYPYVPTHPLIHSLFSFLTRINCRFCAAWRIFFFFVILVIVPQVWKEKKCNSFIRTWKGWESNCEPCSSQKRVSTFFVNRNWSEAKVGKGKGSFGNSVTVLNVLREGGCVGATLMSLTISTDFWNGVIFVDVQNISILCQTLGVGGVLVEILTVWWPCTFPILLCFTTTTTGGRYEVLYAGKSYTLPLVTGCMWTFVSQAGCGSDWTAQFCVCCWFDFSVLYLVSGSSSTLIAGTFNLAHVTATWFNLSPTPHLSSVTDGW